MNLAAASGEDLATLHSNLVLFKSSLQVPFLKYYLFFTFQSGSIQMIKLDKVTTNNPALHSNLVLFKSVHIIPPIYTA